MRLCFYMTIVLFHWAHFTYQFFTLLFLYAHSEKKNVVCDLEMFCLVIKWQLIMEICKFKYWIADFDMFKKIKYLQMQEKYCWFYNGKCEIYLQKKKKCMKRKKVHSKVGLKIFIKLMENSFSTSTFFLGMCLVFICIWDYVESTDYFPIWLVEYYPDMR